MTNTEDTLPQNTPERSNTQNIPKHCVYQTLYTAQECQQTLYKPNKEGHLVCAKNKSQAACSTNHESTQINWLHFVGINQTETLKTTLAPFKIHDLVIEDILNNQQRPKIEDYGDYIFIAARVHQYHGTKLKADQVYLILGKNFVLTFQQHPLGLFSIIREKLQNDTYPVRQKSAAFLAYTLLDRLIDDYFVTLSTYNNRVEHLDKALFDNRDNDSSDLLPRIHRLKRDAMRLRRTLMPLRDVLAQLVRGDFAIFEGESTFYLRDAYDHSQQLLETLDSSRDMVMSMMDIYLSFQSNRMNQQMRVLTVITIIFMPLTVLTGIYGMNFDNMPELHWHYGYFILLGVMLTIIVSLLTFFYRRKWL